eukprot:CAMPEP_0181446840 /NCGR_PEP_ID=MMETSP1110-20121109/26316_1 /TAXON_ID=174948 /ORGANISM="Symbiodinium sp., Strain CCMP421" /LENGTH=358 /DNA_ID=CAMNT_0023570939 /DNA_START=157 /DNA_END=1233 /DNA_ORIENTATION=+
MKSEWTNVVTVYEADWVSYAKWLGCAAVSATAPPASPVVLSLCANDIWTEIASTAIFKAAISHGAVDKMDIIDKIRTGANFFIDGKEAAVKILTYQCEVCNCRFCIPHGFSCSKCGKWCVPETNRHALVLGYRQSSSGSGSLECHTIRNRCRTKDYYLAVGYKVRGSDNWMTQAWWKVGRSTEKKLCFRRGTWLYALFDWDDGIQAASNQVTFSIGDHGAFCLKPGKETKIIERPNSPKYYDELSRQSSSTCSGLGGKLMHFTAIDNGQYGSSNVNYCPSSRSFRANDNGVVENVTRIVEVTEAEMINSTLPEVVAVAEGEEPLVMLDVDPKTQGYKQAVQTGPGSRLPAEPLNELLP